MGFLSPSNRGALATVMLICWTFFAAYGGPARAPVCVADKFCSVGGYMSARVYCALEGTNHRRNIFFTATLLPTCVPRSPPYQRGTNVPESHRFVFVVMFLLNLLLIGAHSSGAVPFGEWQMVL